MQCKNEYNSDFMHENFTKVFIAKELREHRSKMLFEEQKCFLPETQVDTEYELKMRQNSKDCEDIEKEINDRYVVIHSLRDKFNSKMSEIELWNKYGRKNVLNNTEKEAETNAISVRPCPSEDCKGYLSTKWKCGICDIKVCSKCHKTINEEDGSEHFCEIDDLATAKLIMKDTKQCPTCNTPIHKIPGGCDQMWCVKCHACFDWKTLKIVKSRIHNPHFYEWQRDNNNGIAPRVEGDNPCGEYPSIFVMNVRLKDADIDDKKEILKFHRFVAHVQDVDCNRLRWNVNKQTKHDLCTLRWRIAYMLSELTEQDFKRGLVKQYNAKERIHDYYQIFEMFYNVSKDIFNNCINDIGKPAVKRTAVKKTLEDLHFLREFTNKALFEYSKKYGTVCNVLYV
jgi:hypothetical protein